MYIGMCVCPQEKDPGVKKTAFMGKSRHMVASNQVYFTVKALPKA